MKISKVTSLMVMVCGGVFLQSFAACSNPQSDNSSSGKQNFGNTENQGAPLSEPSSSPTPTPVASPTPETTPTPAASPTPETTPTPVASPSPETTPTPVASPSPEPEVATSVEDVNRWMQAAACFGAPLLAGWAVFTTWQRLKAIKFTPVESSNNLTIITAKLEGIKERIKKINSYIPRNQNDTAAMEKATKEAAENLECATKEANEERDKIAGENRGRRNRMWLVKGSAAGLVAMFVGGVVVIFNSSDCLPSKGERS